MIKLQRLTESADPSLPCQLPWQMSVVQFSYIYHGTRWARVPHCVGPVLMDLMGVLSIDVKSFAFKINKLCNDARVLAVNLLYSRL